MAEQTLSVVVQDVEHRSGTSRKTNKPYNLYLVKLSDGNEYKTFSSDIAGLANELKGQSVKVQVHDEQRDGFPADLFIDGIEASGAAGSSPSENVPVQPGVITQIPTSRDFHQTQVANSQNGSSRDNNIRAQMAFKAAAAYFAHNGTGDPEKDLVGIETMAKVIYQKATADALTASESVTEPVTQQW
jgi:hypothetical protein